MTCNAMTKKGSSCKKRTKSYFCQQHLIAHIRDIIKPYKYMELSFFENKTKIIRDGENFFITDFHPSKYSYKRYRKKKFGTCVHLCSYFLHDFKLPYHTYLLECRTKDFSSHFCIIISNKQINLINPNMENTIVVDPGLHIVEKYKNYMQMEKGKFISLTHPYFELYKDIYVPQEEYLPLYLNKRRELVCIGIKNGNPVIRMGDRCIQKNIDGEDVLPRDVELWYLYDTIKKKLNNMRIEKSAISVRKMLTLAILWTSHPSPARSAERFCSTCAVCS